MRLPRGLSGRDLAKILGAVGYVVTRQTGSHMRLTTTERGEHHVTIPAAEALRVGTLASIIAEVARHLDTSTDELARRLFDRPR